MRLGQADQATVSAAVAAAEARTNGEIVTVVAPRSDAYHDVALHWAVLAILGMLASLAAFPQVAERGWALVDPWATRSPTGGLLAVALVLVTATFLLARLLLAWMPLRLALTPGSTEARRVRRRAVELFRVAAERRTKARTGVLLYLSLAERRAEIVADEAIHSRVAPEVWGEAMTALLMATRDGRPGAGMAAAVERIGAVLAKHFPRTEDDLNELSDRLVEL
ncbi:TPM domain-containing protein [uncultured Sphingomonas sp.]|uniref:TPM domain-containing protein n=1 Tax=uncultured Sphingomonas sp. TaxID=158754 RepID=UPI0035CA5302